MIYALLLLASVSWGQEASTTTAIPLIDQIQISNLGKDTRDLLSGRYRQTGKPTFANGFCFGDETCQTTSATAYSVSASTQIVLVADLRTAVTMPVCYSSTITFTTRAVNLRIILSGGDVQAPNASTNFNVLMDGAYISPFSASVFANRFTNAENSGSSGVLSWNYLTTGAVSAGSHSFCLTGNSTAANGVRCDVSPCIFRVEEFQ